MTNEQIVEKIKNGYSVTENIQLLYENNLPLIRMYIKPYMAYEPAEDLLQEAYFGLWEATQHYESSENVLFMTYAMYWIKQAVVKYIEKCGCVVKMPGTIRHKINRYKKCVEKLEQEHGRIPTDAEIAECMGVSLAVVEEIKIYNQSISSIDAPMTEDEGVTIGDSIKADYDLENSLIDKIYDEHCKNELWGIVERYTSDRENEIIQDIFIKNKTLREIAGEQGIGFQRVRQLKEQGLQRLRIGQARKELLARFEVTEASMYRTGLTKYRNNVQSTVEYIAIRKAELEELYEKIKRA